MPATKCEKRFHPSRLIRPLVSVAVIAILLAIAGASSLRKLVYSVELLPVVLALVLHFLVYLIAAWRWWLLIRATGATLPFQKLLPSYFLGLFLNNFFPSSLGGDVARIIHLRRQRLPTHLLIASSAIDRLVGLLTATTIASLFLVLPVQIGASGSERYIMLSISAVALGLVILLLLPNTHAALRRIANNHRLHRFIRTVAAVALNTEAYARNRRAIPLSILLSVLSQIVMVAAYWAMGLAVGLQVPPMAYFVVVPFAFLAGSAPVSIGGLGVREAAIMLLLTTLQVSRPAAVTFALLSLVVTVISTLPGALVLMLQTHTPANLANQKPRRL
ncbi:MAG: lysylphosphatidylglycerol synthase transmembrane domain-containing protein [Acidiferrobacterales bacterium]